MNTSQRLPMKPPEQHSSVREHFAWSYGKLAMSDAAVREGKTRYESVHFMIRAKFRNGYLAGNMKMRPLHDDEKTKIVHGTTCCYCGHEGNLSLDHMIPRLKGGPDAADNIIYACRSCNSSKGSKDMVLWLVSKGQFPAILVFRRYLKLGARWCEENDLMDAAWADLPDAAVLFDKRSLRVQWPSLSELRLWPDPSDREVG